jgi:hypothetical protein
MQACYAAEDLRGLKPQRDGKSRQLNEIRDTPDSKRIAPRFRKSTGYFDYFFFISACCQQHRFSTLIWTIVGLPGG